MYNVGPYTIAPWKVVWRQQASWMTAAVQGPLDGRAVIPNHKLTLVPVETELEAHFLCAVLNSAVVRGIVAGYAIPTGITTHVLEHVAVPRFDPANKLGSLISGPPLSGNMVQAANTPATCESGS